MRRSRLLQQRPEATTAKGAREEKIMNLIYGDADAGYFDVARKRINDATDGGERNESRE